LTISGRNVTEKLSNQNVLFLAYKFLEIVSYPTILSIGSRMSEL